MEIPVLTTHLRSSSALALLFAVGVALSCAGCGGQATGPKDRAVVSGVVSFNGSPLPAGTIGFESVSGPVRSSAPIKDGKFETDRAPLGELRVTVDTSTVQLGNPAAYVPIPERYMAPDTSGLSATIEPGGATDLDFSLTD